MMEKKYLSWVILAFISLIWGSSYILMKWAMSGLTPVQVGALRMLLAAVFLSFFGIKRLKKIRPHQWKYIFYNALLGTFFPVFLFTFSIKHIDSGVVAILNSVTPLLTLLTGYLIFRFYIKRHQITGVLIGFAGTLLLIWQSAGLHPEQNYLYAIPVLLASLGYSLNVNILKKHLNDVSPLAIAMGNFLLVLPAAVVILFFTGFFSLDMQSPAVYVPVLYTAVLALFGTALAKVLFNRLVQISSPVFSSSVTYTIPLVAVLWGVSDGEKIFAVQLIAGLIILAGVMMIGRRK